MSGLLLSAADGDSPGDVADEIGDSASSLLDTIVDALPRIGAALVIVLVGWIASRLVRAGLRRVFERRRSPSFATVMSKVIGWSVLTVVVLLAVAVTFPSVKPVDILAGLGFFSLAVGFAFQDILENTLAGILLLFRQPFGAGDQIEVEGQRGTVLGISIRETRLRAFSGEHIVIPNRDVYKSVIVVTTHFPTRRQEFVVGVGYDTDLEHATALVRDTVAAVDGVAADPPVEVLVADFGTSTIDVDVLFWSDPRRLDGRLVRSRAIVATKRALEDAEVSLPADIIELHATESFRSALGTPTTERR